MDVTALIQDFGFPVVMAVGMGYFIYFVYQTILTKINPAIAEMRTTIIRLIDQMRMLDQDLIRLQEKVNTALAMQENEKKNENINSNDVTGDNSKCN
jgi:uncharacterized coiled-coil protein SlyX